MVRLMCWFVHKHLDFREPELVAVADMLGVQLELEPEPQPPDAEGGGPPVVAAGSLKKTPGHLSQPPSPYRFATFPDEEMAAQIGSRSIMLRGILEVWGEGTTYRTTWHVVDDNCRGHSLCTQVSPLVLNHQAGARASSSIARVHRRGR